MTIDREYPSHPLPAIGVVVWCGDETLIIRRGKPPGMGQWGLIGGAQETGETFFECAIREALEEACIVIEPFNIITAIDGITRDADGKVQYHYSIVEVNARWVSGDAQPASDITQTRWVTLPELRTLNVWSEMLRVVELAAVQRRED
ncbi:MAG: NUDIX domain-containing protein [Alphaproteobacteria bacterium]|nr:NUDIX domain-containing protein [Alphaproteobacteria bacterium]